MSNDTSDDQRGDLIDICILNNLGALIRSLLSFSLSLFLSHGIICNWSRIFQDIRRFTSFANGVYWINK